MALKKDLSLSCEITLLSARTNAELVCEFVRGIVRACGYDKKTRAVIVIALIYLKSQRNFLNFILKSQ